jgi:hypothetical protein
MQMNGQHPQNYMAATEGAVEFFGLNEMTHIASASKGVQARGGAEIGAGEGNRTLTISLGS